MKQYLGYFVSPCGHVFNKDGTAKIFFMAGKSRGYKYVSLYNNGRKKNVAIHRLVALLYVDNPFFYQEVNHKDGNKLNNTASNLEWCSREQNIDHAIKNNLYNNQISHVLQYDGETLIMRHESIRDCAKSIGVNESSIRKACKGSYLVHGYRFSKLALSQ